MVKLKSFDRAKTTMFKKDTLLPAVEVEAEINGYIQQVQAMLDAIYIEEYTADQDKVIIDEEQAKLIDEFVPRLTKPSRRPENKGKRVNDDAYHRSRRAKYWLCPDHRRGFDDIVESHVVQKPKEPLAIRVVRAERRTSMVKIPDIHKLGMCEWEEIFNCLHKSRHAKANEARSAVGRHIQDFKKAFGQTPFSINLFQRQRFTNAVSMKKDYRLPSNKDLDLSSPQGITPIDGRMIFRPVCGVFIKGPQQFFFVTRYVLRSLDTAFLQYMVNVLKEIPPSIFLYDAILELIRRGILDEKDEWVQGIYKDIPEFFYGEDLS